MRKRLIAPSRTRLFHGQTTHASTIPPYLYLETSTISVLLWSSSDSDRIWSSRYLHHDNNLCTISMILLLSLRPRLFSSPVRSTTSTISTLHSGSRIWTARTPLTKASSWNPYFVQAPTYTMPLFPWISSSRPWAVTLSGVKHGWSNVQRPCSPIGCWAGFTVAKMLPYIDAGRCWSLFIQHVTDARRWCNAVEDEIGGEE